MKRKESVLAGTEAESHHHTIDGVAYKPFEGGRTFVESRTFPDVPDTIGEDSAGVVMWRHCMGHFQPVAACHRCPDMGQCRIFSRI